MAYMNGRPSVDMLGGSLPSPALGQGVGLEDEIVRQEDEGETVDSVMNKLAIERRVQYGAEKMLDVIEARGGASDGGDQEQIKERITAQLEAANVHIKMLEARLERLQNATGTPSRTRRRPQPRLNGYGSQQSLNPNLSSSYASSTLSAGRPKLPRQRSNLTPDRDKDAYISPVNLTPSRGFPIPPGTSSSHGSRRRSGSAGSEMYEMADERMGDGTDLIKGLERSLRVLREVARRESGKGKEVDRRKGDEAWETMWSLGEVLKRSEYLRVAVLEEGMVDDLIESLLPFLADSSTPRRRGAAYRVLRSILNRQTWAKMLLNSGVEWLIIRTFTRDSKSIHEREQALRLLRAVIVLPPTPTRRYASPLRSRAESRQGHLRQYASGPGHSRNPSGGGSAHPKGGGGHSRHPSLLEMDPVLILIERKVPLTDGLVRALVSTAENADDPLRTVCMETLLEIGVLDLECLVRSDAFRTILLALKDGPLEMGPAVSGVLLVLVNKPSTRELLLPGADLEAVLVGLTEEYGKVPSRQHAKFVEQLKACGRNVHMLLASWTGLIYLCMNDLRAIRSLISALHVPVPEVRESMVDLLFTALRIKKPSWMNAFLDGKRLTVYNRTQEATSQFREGDEEAEPPQHLNLVDHFVSLLLAVFLEAGLLESLVVIIQESDSSLKRKATLLLGEILQLSNKILPSQYAAQLQALPLLFSGATEFGQPDKMTVALSALSSIDSLTRNQARATLQATKDSSRTHQDSLERGQRQVQQVKLRMGLQVEDKQFQQMINDSGVLLVRDHTKWNYDIIVDLVEGPLLNPKRLDEAIKATKFMKRLFSFFHPFNNRFSSVKRTRPNHKWVKLGCALISTMLVNTEGIRYLSEDGLLSQIVECFNQLHQHAGSFNSHPLLSKDRIEASLTYGYFEMIGTLSRHREGVKLLEKFKIFTPFYHLSEQRSRDDIIRILIECFDYTIDAHPRIVLAKALTSAYMETRLFGTHHLGRLLQTVPALIDWALQLMITQLYDTSMEVCDVAVMYLEEACTDMTYLEKVVQLRPTLEHLGEVGHPLFMRFVSTSVGFRYLHQAQYIEKELETWLQERNLLYVIEVETFVTKTLRPFTTDTVQDYWNYASTAPPHFFGELTKTPEGCQVLRERGIVSDFAEIIRLHGMEAEDQAVLTNVKTILWALGNIGSTEGGLPFLEDEEILEVIVEIAEHSPVLIMKGTCFFVLGLISTTRMGAETLEEYGWVSTRTPLGIPTGLCLPNDISRFAHIVPWVRPDPPSQPTRLPKLSGLEGEIMTAIINLSNYVLAAGAMNNLKRIRSRHPRYFSSITLFHRALYTISTNHYLAPVRRFILDLFDVSLDPDILVQLRHLDISMYRPKATAIVLEHEGETEHYVDGREALGLLDIRRRSASSPGPEPPGRIRRMRGLTISEMEGGKGEHGAREKVRGFGSATVQA